MRWPASNRVLLAAAIGLGLLSGAASTPPAIAVPVIVETDNFPITVTEEPHSTGLFYTFYVTNNDPVNNVYQFGVPGLFPTSPLKRSYLPLYDLKPNTTLVARLSGVHPAGKRTTADCLLDRR